jgi:hypothetical protein
VPGRLAERGVQSRDVLHELLGRHLVRHLPDDVKEERPPALRPAPAFGRDGDQGRAPVVGVGAALDEAVLLQKVDGPARGGGRTTAISIKARRWVGVIGSA